MPCPVCGATASTRAFLARDPHYGIPGSWWIRRCAQCQSLFLEEPPPAAELASLYPQDSYYAYEIPKSAPVRRLVQRAVGVDLRPGDPAFAAPGRVLDFGCGAGVQLADMRAQGWQCTGVEISARAREVASSVGLDVRASLSEIGTAQFDYVRAYHSLEHVADPRATLSEFFRVLRPGGTLFLGVPTASGLNARLFREYWWFLTPPLHVVAFSTSGLHDLVTRTGFTVTDVATRSDYGGTAGSLQIWLNRHTAKRSTDGWIMRMKPLRLLGHWIARAEDALGLGDKLELVATKPG